MKIWPTAPQAAKPRMSLPTAGCCRMKARAEENSFAAEENSFAAEGGIER